MLYYAGEELNLKNAATRFKYAKKAQIIFQDPYASLDPRMTVSSIIEEGMVIHGMYDAKRRQERVYELLELVGLNKSTPTASRMSSPAASASVSALPVRSLSSRNSSCAMSRSQHWTFPSSPRSSTCCTTCSSSSD